MNTPERPLPAWQEEARLLGTLICISLIRQPLPVQLDAISRALSQLVVAGGYAPQDYEEARRLIDRIGAAVGKERLDHVVVAYAYLLHDCAVQAEEMACEIEREG